MRRVMMPPAIVLRVWNTAVFWTWLFNGLRFASGLLLMPLLLRKLSEHDLSIYSQFVFLTAFLYTLDIMFSSTIARNAGYAMQGVRDIQSVGIADAPPGGNLPNVPLLGQLFATTRVLYRYLSLAILFLLGVGGTLVLWQLFPGSSDPARARLAWVITIIGACLELYTGYWLVFLRGMNRVVLSARLSAGIYALKLLVSFGLLLAGFGLLAVPVSALVSGFVQRMLARKYIRENMPAGFAPDPSRNRELMSRIWPNSWRTGLVAFSMNVVLVSFGTMIAHLLDERLTYRFQFSQQIIYGVCMNMATVWTLVKWPMVNQLRSANDLGELRRLIWPRVWLQTLSFIVLCAAAVIAAPPLLQWVAPNKELLPRIWLVVLGAHALLEMQYAFWSTLLTAGNRVPSLWAAVATSMASILVAYLLVKTTSFGLGSFVLSPLLCGLAFNFWYWPKAGAASLGTSWFRFMFQRPKSA